MLKRRNRRRKQWIFVGLLIALLSVIPLRLWRAVRIAPQPQAIFVLGGHPDRERAAAQIARYYLELDIWVSSGSEPDVVSDIFRSVGISSERLHLDYQASDTVTNFTTLLTTFKSLNLKHLLLITSDFHMTRARTIALFVLGGHGIAYTPQPVPSSRPLESNWLAIRDAARSIVWLLTGYESRCNPSMTSYSDCEVRCFS